MLVAVQGGVDEVEHLLVRAGVPVLLCSRHVGQLVEPNQQRNRRAEISDDRSENGSC